MDVFCGNDKDKSSTLNKAEFLAAVRNRETRKLLQRMGAGVDWEFMVDADIDLLFDLIDVDESGELAPQEFVNGLMRMKGPASARSIFGLHCELQKRSNRTQAYHRDLS